MRRAILFVVVISACNDAKSDGVDRETRRVDDLGGKARAVLDAPLVPTDGTVGGVAFRIGLPDGYAPERLGTTAGGPRWGWAAEELGVSMPTIEVRKPLAAQLPTSLDGVRSAYEPDELVRAGEAPGGYFVAYRRARPRITGYTRWILRGETSLECSGTSIDDRTVSDDEAIALIERACLSLEPR